MGVKSHLKVIVYLDRKCVLIEVFITNLSVMNILNCMETRNIRVDIIIQRYNGTIMRILQTTKVFYAFDNTYLNDYYGEAILTTFRNKLTDIYKINEKYSFLYFFSF